MISMFKPASPSQVSAGLLILRVAAGLTLAGHGWQKVFTSGIAGVTAGFEKMGVPLASVSAPAVSLLELVGGLALAAGLLTRPFALLLAIDLLVASLLVHRPNGFYGQGGMELTMMLAAMTATLAFTGAGAFSADAAIGGKDRP